MADESYHRIGSRIWFEPWDDDTMITAIYLLTNTHRTSEGLYRLPLEYAATDRRWPLKRFRKAFDHLLADGFVEYDDQSQVVLIVKALSWWQPANPNQRKAAAKKLRSLPRTHLLARWYALAQEHAQPFAEWLAQEHPDLFGEPLAKPFRKPLAKGVS